MWLTNYLFFLVCFQSGHVTCTYTCKVCVDNGQQYFQDETWKMSNNTCYTCRCQVMIRCNRLWVFAKVLRKGRKHVFVCEHNFCQVLLAFEYNSHSLFLAARDVSRERRQRPKRRWARRDGCIPKLSCYSLLMKMKLFLSFFFFSLVPLLLRPVLTLVGCLFLSEHLKIKAWQCQTPFTDFKVIFGYIAVKKAKIRYLHTTYVNLT